MSELTTILHVEDDADIQEIAQLALEMVGGLQVSQFSSGADAVDNAGDLAPDLILLDQMMPGMSGEETLYALRRHAHLQNVPAIFMTAQTEDSSAALVERTGALGFVSKPFDPMTLADELRAMMARTSA